MVDTLPKLTITQSDVDASAECPVCKDFFAVDEEVHKLPCAHLFHPDCILPWLKQVGSRGRALRRLAANSSCLPSTAQLVPGVPLRATDR